MKSKTLLSFEVVAAWVLVSSVGLAQVPPIPPPPTSSEFDETTELQKDEASDTDSAAAEPITETAVPVDPLRMFAIRLDQEPSSGKLPLLFIDGDYVGPLPWSGILPPGDHTYTIQYGERGTAPAPTSVGPEPTIIRNKALKPLGPELQIVVEPRTARLSIDGAVVSTPWVGRLPLGKHQLSAAHPAYGNGSHALFVTPTTRRNQSLRLSRSSEVPSDRAATSHSLELVPAFLFGTSLGSEAEESCSQFHCTHASSALGGVAALRFGVGFLHKLRFELSAGAIYLGKEQTRRFSDDSLPDYPPVNYEVSDKLRVRGPFVGIGMAYHQPVAQALDLGARLQAGLSQVFARHRSDGILSDDDDATRVQVRHSDAVERNILLFGWPEVFISYHPSRWRFGAGLGALVLLNRAQRSNHGDLLPLDSPPAPCDSLACAPGSSKLEGERPFGPSLLFSVSAFGGWTF